MSISMKDIMIEKFKRNFVTVFIMCSGLLATVIGWTVPKWLDTKVTLQLGHVALIISLMMTVLIMLVQCISSMMHTVGQTIELTAVSYTTVTHEFILKSKHNFQIRTILIAYLKVEDVSIPMGRAMITNITDITQVKVTYFKAFREQHGDIITALENNTPKIIKRMYLSNIFNADILDEEVENEQE